MENKIDLIRQYINNELSGEALASFEKQLLTDSELAQELAFVQNLKKVLTHEAKYKSSNAELRTTHDKLGKKYFTKEAMTEPVAASVSFPSVTPPKSTIWSKLAIAASIAILIFAGSFFIGNDNVAPESLAVEYFIKAGSGVRGEVKLNQKTLMHKLEDANTAFSEKDYARSSQQYASILSSKDDPQYKKDEINFEVVQWNYIMAQLAAGNVEDVKQQLKTLMQSDISKTYKKKGEELTNKLSFLASRFDATVKSTVVAPVMPIVDPTQVLTDSLMQFAKDNFSPDGVVTMLYADSVIAIATEQKDHLKLYDAFMTKAYCARFQQDFHETFDHLKNAAENLNLVDELLKTDSFEIELNYMWGDYYAWIGNDPSALVCIQSNIDRIIKKQQPTDWEKRQLTKAYDYIGIVYDRNRKFDAALESFQFQIAYSKEHGLKVVDSQIRLGEYCFKTRNFNKAIEYFEKGLPPFEEKYNIDDSIYKINYGNSLMQVFGELGYSYAFLNKKDSAIAAFQKANTFEINHELYKIKLLLNEAKAHAIFGNSSKAIQLFDKASAITDSYFKEKNMGAIETYLSTGDFYLQHNNPVKALGYYQKGIIDLIADFNETDFNKNPELINIASDNKLIGCLRRKVVALSTLSDQSNDRSYQTLAWETGQLALELMQNSLQKYDLLNSDIIGIVDDNYSLFETMLHIGYDLGDEYHQELFSVLEQSKSFALLKTLKEANALQHKDLPKDLVNDYSVINFEITQLEESLFGLKSKQTKVDSLIHPIETKLFQKKEVRKKLKGQIAEITQPNELNSTLQTLKSIQQTIAEVDEAILEYFVGDQYSFGVLIKQDTMIVERLQLSSELLTAAGTLKEEVFHKNDSAYMAKAYTLYTALIQPFEKYHLPIKLVVIPDGPLYYLPFELLLSDNEVKPFKDLPYLIRDHAFSYCFSAALLHQLENKKHVDTPISKVLAYAPSFKSTSKDDRSVAETRGILDVLHYTDDEVKQIGQYYSTHAEIGTSASKANFIEQVSEYRYVHLATHALVNDKDPDFSYIAFSNIEHTNDNDFKLYANELANLTLNADMVVLSACETGVGKVYRGEGIISIARGFVVAGAKSIFTTLWSVNDLQTAPLMESFYKNLNTQNITKDEAMRQAKLDYLDNVDSFDAHPKYWGAFVSYGDMKCLDQGSSFDSLFTIRNCIVGLMSLFVLGYIGRKMLNSNRQIP